MEITFDPVQVAFVCQPEGATVPVTVPARGLNKADSMGDLAWMLALPAYQLAFPFSPKEQRRLSLIECLRGTTLRDTTADYDRRYRFLALPFLLKYIQKTISNVKKHTTKFGSLP
jgi:hypothetical protein